jgi:hypothetical protein
MAMCATAPVATNPSITSDSFSLGGEKSDKEATWDSSSDPITTLISKQTFEGFWESSPDLLHSLTGDSSFQLDIPALLTMQCTADLATRIFTTLLVVEFLDQKALVNDIVRDSTELIIVKARAWLLSVMDGEVMSKVQELSKEVIKDIIC